LKTSKRAWRTTRSGFLGEPMGVFLMREKSKLWKAGARQVLRPSVPKRPLLEPVPPGRLMEMEKYELLRAPRPIRWMPE
jgi:hypothetical protein